MPKLKKQQKNSTKSRKSNASSGLPEERKYEILGILLIAVALMLLVSIVTYHDTDWSAIQEQGSASLERLESRIQNGLGWVGAHVAHLFVYNLFGYISAVLPISMIWVGWFVFRKKDLHPLIYPISLLNWSMVLIATCLGWLNIQFDWDLVVTNGTIGYEIASFFNLITGFYGSIIILSSLILITLLLSVGKDFQSAIDKIKHSLENFSLPSLPERKAKAEEETEKEDSKAAPKSSKKDKKAEADDEEDNSNIDDILEASRKREAILAAKRKEEEDSIDQRPRAILEKDIPTTVDESGQYSFYQDEEEKSSTPEIQNTEAEEDKDPEVEVFKGEGDEAAGAKELDKQNSKASKELATIKYRFPGIDLLTEVNDDDNTVDFEEIEQNKRIILEKLRQHKIEILSINAIVGPTVTLYELEPAPHVKIGKIESYANDLKMATASHGIRIIAPIPGKSAVGIEVPNHQREVVHIRQVINTKKFVESKYDLPVAFGKTIENENFLIDLTKMPHLLVAGATGSGKSVGINTIITCLLYKCHPENLKFVLIDPKKIELSLYRSIERHFLAALPHADEPIITDTSKAMETLQSVCKEMDERYDLLKMAHCRNIKEYNQKFKTGTLEEDLGHRHLPYIVVIIDELADLMMTAGKQIEEPIARLAQLARAIGIHLVVATQRPSVNVITGTIKANFPARIAYQVASKVDSRTILDSMGADQLVGKGDMLFTNGGATGMIRIQNAFVSTEEVESITNFIGRQAGYEHPYYLPVVEDETNGLDEVLQDRDSMFEEAAKTVVLHQQGSVSLLQRKLKLGYNRAGRIIDQLYAAGIVGPSKGSTARDVLVSDDEELTDVLRALDN